MSEATVAQQRCLVNALQQALSHTGALCEVIETHISWVLLAGEFAYKIKKAVNFGFLDYSTLARRKTFCEEEVRLNQRTAPELYLAAVPIAGPASRPQLEGAPVEALEWAVKMYRFSQDQLLDQRLAKGALDTTDMDTIAGTLADFHSRIPVVDPAERYGDPDEVYRPILDNFPAIHAALGADAHGLGLERHAAWAAQTFERLRPRIAARKQQGRVRECHGDLHLGNMVQWEDRVIAFDAIEFNPHLRWIDAANELAFIAMDLEARGHPELARHLVNAWLERTGDYDAVPLLDFYKHYRAMVRTKVAALRLAQTPPGSPERRRLMEELGAYLTLAASYLQPTQPALILTCGVTGSGKTRIAGLLVDQLARTVRIRSDVERKRLFGLAAEDRSRSGMGDGLYTPDASARTYARLRELAATVIDGGYTALLDATFLRRTDRVAAQQFAQGRLPFLLIVATAPDAVLRERVRQRHAEARDASEADLQVLEKQLATQDPLLPEETDAALFLDTAAPYDGPSLAAAVEARLRNPV